VGGRGLGRHAGHGSAPGAALDVYTGDCWRGNRLELPLSLAKHRRNYVGLFVYVRASRDALYEEQPSRSGNGIYFLQDRAPGESIWLCKASPPNRRPMAEMTVLPSRTHDGNILVQQACVICKWSLTRCLRLSRMFLFFFPSVNDWTLPNLTRLVGLSLFQTSGGHITSLTIDMGHLICLSAPGSWQDKH
jgi:hypothetical protein